MHELSLRQQRRPKQGSIELHFILICSVKWCERKTKRKQFVFAFCSSQKFQNLKCSTRLKSRQIESLFVMLKMESLIILDFSISQCWQLSRNGVQNIFNRLGYFTINQSLFLLDRLSHSIPNTWSSRKRKLKQTRTKLKLGNWFRKVSSRLGDFN